MARCACWSGGGCRMRSLLRRPGRALAGPSPATWGELLARIGRLVLWLAVVFVLVRGLAGIANAQRPAPERPGAGGAQVAAVAWPDDAARAFAVQFVTAYLTHAPGEDAGA